MKNEKNNCDRPNDWGAKMWRQNNFGMKEPLWLGDIYLDSQQSSNSSVDKVAILQTTGYPQKSGFPSTSRKN